MAADYAKFDRYAPQMIADLMHDFGFTDWQAAAFPGNAAAESAYFTDIIEDGALAKGRAGGTGWMQWTGLKAGQRRALFEAWLKRKGWKADSYEGNYSFLYRELAGLEGTEKGIVARVKACKTLEEASDAVCEHFLRPLHNNFAVRRERSRYALMKFRAAPPKPTKWPTDPQPAPAPVRPEPPTALKEGLTMFMNAIIKALPMILDRVQKEAFANPAIPVHSEAPKAAANAVTTEVMKEIAQIPEVQHITNTETHWYQQRSKWSTIVSIVLVVATPMLAKYGFEVTPERQEFIETVCVTGGGLWAAYLAYRAGTAKKPLGA